MSHQLPGDGYERFCLSNGLRLIVSEMPGALSATCGLYVGVGARHEGSCVAGVSHFVEHMAFKGTAGFPTPESISGAIEGVGGYINAGTDHELTTYYAKVPYLHSDLAMKVLADLARSPLLQGEDFERERSVILEELHSIIDAPDALGYVLSQGLTWGDEHPLGREVVGTEDSLAGMTIDAIREHVQLHYGPNQSVLAVAGRVDPSAVLEQAERFFGDWRTVGAGMFEPAPAPPSRPRLRVHYRDTEQVQVYLTLPGYHRDHPDRYTLGMIQSLLGAGMSSRLFVEIRERKALAYAVASVGASYQDAGLFGLYAAVNPGQAVAAIEALLGEWTRVSEETVPLDELSRVRRLVRGRRLLSLEESSSVAAWFGQQELLSDVVRTSGEVLEIFDAITTDEILRVARDLVSPTQLTLAIVGPFKDADPFSECIGRWSGGLEPQIVESPLAKPVPADTLPA